ncbi:Signal peptidase complex subunit 3 [Araneus ventricosus]|uniref:Signal peptidase complex subunit 3 n=1 Tax=Araneus ventricosus TaxID=182803 RepID=A0A4Y2I6I2_ARAVE|nr:Signal peptidase complex subunit 3 [Araneus ventricosus]
MNTVLSRANAIFAFSLSVLACLTFLCFLSTAFNEYSGNVTLSTAKAVVKNVPDFSASRWKNDLGFVTFDLQADLTHLFNWNVKQLFIYLTAEYTTESNVVNQVVLWDKIIKRNENATLDYKKMNTKYYFWDDGNGLRGNKNVSLYLSWNIIPNAGSLPNINGNGVHIFTFPDEYFTSKLK